MEPLVTVPSVFEATVIAARLGADGIVTEQRGAMSTYPVSLGGVRIYVRRDDLSLARDLLLADEVESALEGAFEAEGSDGHGDPSAWYRRRWVKVAALVMLAAGAGSRVV